MLISVSEVITTSLAKEQCDITYDSDIQQRYYEMHNSEPLSNDSVVDNAVDIGEAVVATAVEVCQLRVVHAH